MAYILSIDTATEAAYVVLGNEHEIISFRENKEQKTHASFVQPAINEILKENGMSLNDIDAVSVSNGPGSYTGLRVGLSSAKGIAYALNKPLILLNTLEIMAQSAILELKDEGLLYCPMIDARRMEVFTAIYNISLNNLFVPSAVILSEDSFKDILESNKVVFFGSGAEKSISVIKNSNASFLNIEKNTEAINLLAHKHFILKDLADLAYAEPFYLKSFYTHSKL